MKYILKQKFHPNQVEEIGHVFEADIYYRITYKDLCSPDVEHWLQVHEIALLIHAGFLEAEKITDELSKQFSTRYVQAGQIHECAHCTPEKGYDPTEKYGVQCTCKCHSKAPEQKIDLSAEQFKYILAKYNAEILNKFQDEYLMVKGPGCEEMLFPVLEKAIESFTKESAEEALKLLKEHHNIES